MKVGISTACFFPMLTETALETLLNLGCRTIEVFLNSPSEGKESFAASLKGACDAAGASIVAVHPCSSGYEGYSFFGRYERRFADGVEEYRRLFEAVRIMGADVVAFHGARAGIPIEPGLYVERFGLLDEVARSFGVRLCHENVVDFQLQTPAAVAWLRRALPDVHFLFDIKQALRARVDPLEMLDAMGSNLSHVHISDHDSRRDCLPPGVGEADFETMIEKMIRLGFDGSLIVEVYSGCFEHFSELRNSEKFIRKILWK